MHIRYDESERYSRMLKTNTALVKKIARLENEVINLRADRKRLVEKIEYYQGAQKPLRDALAKGNFEIARLKAHTTTIKNKLRGARKALRDMFDDKAKA